MQQFIEKYKDDISGVLTGFDRLVLRGSPRRLDSCYYDPARKIVVAKGMEEFLWQNEILFKHYSDYVKKVSERVKKAATKAYQEAGLPVICLRAADADKEECARRVAVERRIEVGPVCVLSAIEPCPTFDYVQSKIARRRRPCHVLYQYRADERFGWMYARIQTWFPFHIQIGLNGREWLARQMRERGWKFKQKKNCFPWLEDFARAQELMKEQLKTDWVEALGAFARQLNPLHEEIFAKYPTEYYWTCYQSEWATDVVFRDVEKLKRLMRALVPHGMLSFDSRDVLRFFGKRTTKAGRIPLNFHGELQGSYREYQEGERVKFWMDGNSVKTYDKAYTLEGSVLRAAETTINNVTVFKTYRPKEGGAEEDLQWRQMRKGVADLHRRAEVSQRTNERVLNALASVDDSRRLEELIAGIQQPVTWKGRRVRGLRPLGDDQALLQAINHGDFLINGFRNRDLQAILFEQPVQDKTERRRRSAAISRKLRMLRAHGLIHKISHTHRYMVNPDATTILIAILTAARTTLNQINQLADAA
jgi:hypothetical protein